MESELQTTTPKALWLLVVLPSAILAAAMEANFILVRHACSAHHGAALHAVSVIAIVLLVATAFVAFSIWTVEGWKWPTEGPDLSARIRFLAVVGILNSAISFLVVLAQAIATIKFDPCQL